jgi:iron complex transport system substrate-binding protein
MRRSTAGRVRGGLFAAALWALGSAAGVAAAEPAAQTPIRLVDDDQHTLVLPRPAQRLVSLSPGATEMLFAAGAGERVVGTSEYSDSPPAARAIARIGDSQSFDLERILGLHPDVVVVWDGGTSPAQIARLEHVGLAIYYQRLAHLDDIPASLARLGRLAGTEAQAQATAAALSQRIAALRREFARAPAASVLIQVWDRPIYTVGREQLMTDVIHVCGYRNLYEDLLDPAPAVALESVLARNPDIILALAPDRQAESDWLAGWKAYPSLKAVRNARVLGWTDRRLSGLGPGMVDAAEDLCRALRR